MPSPAGTLNNYTKARSPDACIMYHVMRDTVLQIQDLLNIYRPWGAQIEVVNWLLHHISKNVQTERITIFKVRIWLCYLLVATRRILQHCTLQHCTLARTRRTWDINHQQIAVFCKRNHLVCCESQCSIVQGISSIRRNGICTTFPSLSRHSLSCNHHAFDDFGRRCD